MTASPPSRRDLTSWWTGFKKKTKKEEESIVPPTGIFGVPLATSIKYANVAISLNNEQGESYTYGYVPIVIAKCGVFLKEKGTDIHGIFRLPGSAKRIKELQTIFDSPDRYGKGLDWTGYTVHDAGSIFRRYINSLPEPVIPLEYYEQYRAPIRQHQKEATGDPEAPPDPSPASDFNHNNVIAHYQKLITELPPLNRQLLLYLLDLLAVFSSKSETNGMDSFNLSAVFQPGILSHPKHDLVPHEYKLSQNVLVYLIMNQDHFLVGMSGTEADEKTVKDVQNGPPRQVQTPAKVTHAGLGRSASNASTGADSLRKAGLRRNASISSRQSNLSNTQAAGSPAPSSPLINATGVQRSNTVPSKRSPGLNSPRLNKAAPVETTTPRSSSQSPAPPPTSEEPAAPAMTRTDETIQEEGTPAPVVPAVTSTGITDQTEKKTNSEGSSKAYAPEIPTNDQLRVHAAEPAFTTTISSGTPSKDRKSFFARSPTGDHERRDSRQPNKLKKKARSGEAENNASAQTSTHSLSEGFDGASDHPNKSPKSPKAVGQNADDRGVGTLPTLMSTDASPSAEDPPKLGELDKVSSFHVSRGGSREPSPGVRPAHSPVPSVHSGPVTEDSEGENAGGDTKGSSQKRRSRWRLSAAVKKDHEPNHVPTTLASTAVPEENSVKDESPPQRPRKSATEESQPTTITTESLSLEKDHEADERERKGLFGRIKAKVHKAKEEKDERAKSPPRATNEKATSKQSLNAIAAEAAAAGPATEAKNEGTAQSQTS